MLSALVPWILGSLSWLSDVGALLLTVAVIALVVGFWSRTGRRIARNLAIAGIAAIILGAALPSGPSGSRPSASASGPASDDPLDVAVTALAEGGWAVELPEVDGATEYRVRLDSGDATAFTEAGTHRILDADRPDTEYLPGPVHEVRVSVLRGSAEPVRAVTRFCSPVVILGARGTDENDPRGNFRHGAGDAVTRTTRLLARQAGVLPRDERVAPTVIGLAAAAYPATASGYARSRDQGIRDLESMMAEVARDCPQSRVALVGFSQGADVVNSAWLRQPEGSGLVLGVIAYADPHFDRQWAGQGIAWPRDAAFGKDSMLGGRGRFPSELTARVQQWCYVRDPVCQSRGLIESAQFWRWHGGAYDAYQEWAAYALAPDVIAALAARGYPSAEPVEPSVQPASR